MRIIRSGVCLWAPRQSAMKLMLVPWLEMLNLFVENPQYKHFLCGMTHDNGYARILNQYSDKSNKITLLDAGPSANELRHLQFNRWTLPSVFRSNHFLRRQVEYPSQTAESQATEAASSTGSNSNLSMPMQSGTMHNTQNAGRNEIWLNASGARIDAPPRGGFPPKAKSTLEKRIKSSSVTLCPAHYLSSCLNSECALTHSVQLSEDEKAALRYKMRTFLCKEGSSCRSFDCFWSHVCPFNVNCHWGLGCKFSAYHGIDRAVHTRLQPPSTPVVEPAALVSDI